LLSSIQKHLSIMDTSKSLAHGCIEVDATHWNRIAFLALYSNSLIPSLHLAVHARIRPKLGIDINSIERKLYGDEADHDGIPLDSTLVTDEHGETQGTCATGDNGDSTGTDNLDEHLGGNGDADQDYELEDNKGINTTMLNSQPLHPDDSSFGDNGRPVIFSTGKFWDFVNISLENVHKIAKEEAMADQSGNTGYKTAFRQ
ncbi:uncharacterized protein BJ212DRAFT_1284262, partial [Suillus subaureus]